MIPEYVTVTVRNGQDEDLGDFKIPTGMTAGRLLSLLLSEGETDYLEPTLCLNGYAIPPAATIGEAGIWDGSIIILREGSA